MRCLKIEVSVVENLQGGVNWVQAFQGREAIGEHSGSVGFEGVGEWCEQ